MTKLLDVALSRLRDQTAAEQDAAAHVLLAFLDRTDMQYRLTPEQVEDVQLTLDDLAAGRERLLTPDETDAMWRRLGI